MYRAMAFPQQYFGHFDLLRGQSAHRQIGVPHQHFCQRNIHQITCPAAQMLIREKQHFFAPRKCPLQNLPRIAGGAYNAAVLAAKCFEIGSRVDVGNRRNRFVGIQHFADLTPRALNLGEIRHVGHRATRAHVGQDHRLLRLGQNVRHFGHEVHAAEHQVVCIGTRREL